MNSAYTVVLKDDIYGHSLPLPRLPIDPFKQLSAESLTIEQEGPNIFTLHSVLVACQSCLEQLVIPICMISLVLMHS